ncbi:hypothetical protein PA25_27640 [Pseudoalteromonas sp. A25]|uniref:hypothetical protein n=1 Tax=Pseudoalteromonas sp. A25 TaxID=116092 RepID=UPI0012608020|nr:hypothetical protein [Pseudoalteromonas sp. A25]BBN82779.1 hypothetical protein PA25_27640 [Pseudoalteromonas sp. A25]
MNTINEQEATLSAQATTLVEKEGRQTLIEKFDDLKSPTGDDFEAMIRSSFNQVDDPIKVVEQDGQTEIEVSSAVSVRTDAQANEQLRLTPSQLTMTQGGANTLNVDGDTMVVFDDVLTVSNSEKKVTVADTLQADHVVANTQLSAAQVQTEALSVSRGELDVMRAELDINDQPRVSVFGDAGIEGSLNVIDTVEAANLNVSETASLAETHISTLTVDGETTLNDKLTGRNGVFTEHLEARDGFGIGIDAQSTQAKLHISKTSSDMDALLRVDDHNSDTTPFYIDSEGKVGVGTTNIQADFQVNGSALIGDLTDNHYVQLNNQDKSYFQGNVSVSKSVAIGSEELPSEAGCLSVDGNLALGKSNATAKLDVLGDTSSSLLHVATEATEFLTVTDTPAQGESKIKLYQQTNIKDDLHVDGDTTASNVTAQNHLASDSAAIENTLTAGQATTGELIVNGNATVAQKTTSQKLWVGDTQQDVSEQDSATGALINTTMTVKERAQFKDIHASEMISTQTALKAQSAYINQGVNIGELGESLHAKVAVKTNGEDESALLLKDYEDNTLLRVKKQGVQVGSAAMAVPVNVEGKITAPELNVTYHAQLEQAKVNKGVHIASPVDMSNWQPSAKLAVLSNLTNNTGLDVSYFDGQGIKPIITTKADKLGIFASEPLKPFHVDCEALLTGPVEIAGDVNITHAANSLFSIKDQIVTIGQTDFATPFQVFGETAFWGSHKVIGSFAVYNESEQQLINVADSQVQMTQHTDTAALKVSDPQQSKATYVAAGQLAINQTVPEADVNFALTGKAHISGEVHIEGGELTLTVDGDTQLNNALAVQGATTIEDGLSISVTNNSAEFAKDALTVTGNTTLDGTLSVADAVDLHNGLTITNGETHLNEGLTVEGQTLIDNTLTINGRVNANDSVKIAKQLEGNSLQVEGRAQFDSHVDIDGDLNLSDNPASARVHIQEQGKQGLLIERQGGQIGLVFNDGRLGLGVERPDYALDVAEDSQFRKDVQIKGRLEVDESLHVDEYASFRSNINVHGNAELAGEARFGLPFSSVIDEETVGMPAGIAQVAIDQNHFAKAFAVYHQGEKPIVIEDGKLGVQTDSPREALDINGNAVFRGDIELDGVLRGSGRLECFDGAKIFGDVELRSDLTVHDDALLKDTLTVEGNATFNRQVEVHSDSTFQASVRLNDELSVQKRTHLRDDLVVAKHTTLQGGLTVEGLEVDSLVAISPAATFKSDVTVHGHVEFLSSLQTAHEVRANEVSTKAVQMSGEVGEHAITLNSNQAAAPLSVSAAETEALHITPTGDVGMGTQVPSHKLDVAGDVRVRNTLVVEQGLTLAQGAIAEGDFTVQGNVASESLQLGDTQAISGVSSDVELGGDMASDETLATQAAVKAYVDAHCWTLAENNKVLLIQNQLEFDEVMSREILSNVTILLLPHMCHPQMNRAYKLKQPVRIGSNVSIIGFNERETRIVKEHAGCRFLIHGQSDALVKSVEMRGFTFDGALMNGGVYEGNGGAFHLRYVQSAKLNCVIENHHVNGDGGALYGEAEVSGIEANNIKNCSATRQGGGVFGVTESSLTVSMCRAEYGGGVAYCDDCQVVARSNVALVYGGGAYKCQNLMAQGYWRDNRAQGDVGHHIYSAGCDNPDDGHTHHDYLWHALYLDAPVMCGTQPWRHDHI